MRRGLEPVLNRVRRSVSLSPKQRTKVHLVLWILIVAQIAVVAWVAQHLRLEETYYLVLAHNVLAGHGYSSQCGGRFMTEGWRLPAYPLFLAGVEWLFGSSLRAVVASQAILYLASILLLYLLAKRIAKEAGTIFLFLCAIYPAVAYASVVIESEVLCVFLISAAFYLVARPTWIRCILAGLALGLSAYCRPNLLPLGIVLSIGIAIAQKKISKASVVAGFSLLALIPLSTWNYAHFGKFTPLPVAGGSGLPLFYGAWEAVLPSSQLTHFANGGAPSELLIKSGMVDQLMQSNTAVGAPPYNQSVVPGCSIRQAQLLDSLLRHWTVRDAETWPLAYVWHELSVGVTNWFPTLALRRFPQPIRTLLWIELIVMPLFGLFGLFKLISLSEEGRLLGWTALSGVVFFTFSLGLFVSQSRYTVPLRMVLVVGAAVLLEGFLKKRVPTADETS